ncbi:MAG: hypothetical protein LKH15_09695, partial [Lachnospiraceae bacterium]|nr:hypothetical protein [Lachnospiraceae bacterium]
RSPRERKLPRAFKAKASVFRRWLVKRAYSPHPEPPVLRVEAITRIDTSEEERGAASKVKRRTDLW